VKRVVAVVLSLALVLPARAAAQQERLAGRVPEASLPALTVLLDSARMAGLPTDPLINKALEGASKGADATRIVAAVRALATGLRAARAALGGASTEAELVAGAAALRAGVAPAFLTTLRREHQGRVMVVPLAVMADLIARGVPADTAARTVVALARAGAREDELVAFRQSVERDIALGAPAGASASVRVTAAARDLAPAGPGGGSPPPPNTPSRPRKP
jgi:hypothetical protein